MLNTKIYKSVHSVSEKLMKAANKKDAAAFDLLYSELKAICIENDNTDKDHPVQWEALADFTDDLECALEGYEIALKKATALNSKDYMSSIAFSMARLQVELNQTQAAIQSLQNAKISANKIVDKELKQEIEDLLHSLLTD